MKATESGQDHASPYEAPKAELNSPRISDRAHRPSLGDVIFLLFLQGSCILLVRQAVAASAAIGAGFASVGFLIGAALFATLRMRRWPSANVRGCMLRAALWAGLVALIASVALSFLAVMAFYGPRADSPWRLLIATRESLYVGVVAFAGTFLGLWLGGRGPVSKARSS
jgi:hypothetical protein